VTQVVIQPSYGNRDAWRHWEDTLDKEVPYSEVDHAATLSDYERAALDLLHPTGRARFWGATGNHDAKMATLRTGDIVLFTGQKLVRAVGEVGYSFRNAAFADTLWDPHSERGSYRNVYSLLNFQATFIPYEEIWDLPGFNAGDNFMGLRFLDADKSATVLAGLRIHTATEVERTAEQDQYLAEALGPGSVIGVEAVNVTGTSYQRLAGTTLVHRAEALLVAAYRASLEGTRDVGRVRTPSGVTDLYVVEEGEAEIVEAKRSADHAYVREALGQLLDYVAHAPHPVTRLSALFPQRPATADVSLLHRYGADCLYRRDDGSFSRLPAPDQQRELMRPIWMS
jgi:hypothetical protein